MTPPTIYAKIHETAESVLKRFPKKPEVGMILGSGLGSIADRLADSVTIPYTEIPYFHGTSVEGHQGQMVLGLFQGVPTVALKGRFHLYEGYPMEEVAFPTRALCGMGIHTLVLTNAAGGINTRFRPGDLMLIEDHLNLMGDNPLKGRQIAELGPRFPDLSEAYSRRAARILSECADTLAIPLHRGIYAGLLGPTYETPAEVRMLRTLGADAVGMSTVPEAIAANHLGVSVCGLSCITNLAAGLTAGKLTHDEVISISRSGAERIGALLESAIPKLAKPGEAT